MSSEQLDPEIRAAHIYANLQVPRYIPLRNLAVRKLADHYGPNIENELYRRRIIREYIDEAAAILTYAMLEPNTLNQDFIPDLDIIGELVHTIEEPHSEQFIHRLLGHILNHKDATELNILRNNETVSEATRRIMRSSYLLSISLPCYSEKQTGPEWHNTRTDCFQITDEMALLTRSYEDRFVRYTNLILLPLDQNPEIAQGLRVEAQRYSLLQPQT